MRLSVRARTTAAFAAVMLALLAALSGLAYTQMSAALLDEIDAALRFRAVTALQTLPTAPTLRPDPRLQEPTEAFEQVLTVDGTVESATTRFPTPVLRPAEVSAIHAPTLLQRTVSGVAGTARLLAVPTDRAGRRVLVVVGASMSDRTDALHDLATVLLIGGPIAVAVACVAAWLVAGWVLRPMEWLRAQAAAITASGTDRRLSVPRTRDEIQRLALTLNAMLDRLARSMAGERAFLERAGHELRTPLAALRTEVDLALHRRRSADDLEAALRSVSEETDRLARLADDLLVLARAADGRLPLHRQSMPLRAPARLRRRPVRSPGRSVQGRPLGRRHRRDRRRPTSSATSPHQPARERRAAHTLRRARSPLGRYVQRQRVDHSRGRRAGLRPGHGQWPRSRPPDRPRNRHRARRHGRHRTRPRRRRAGNDHHAGPTATVTPRRSCHRWLASRMADYAPLSPGRCKGTGGRG